MDTLFISDVHLCQERPEKLALLQALLRGPAREAHALYILGDLFEHFWLGNDERTPPAPQVLSELKDFTASGGQLFILRGNRELVLDRGITELTGGKLLPDLSIVEIAGKQILLCHGDILCSRDIGYQTYRQFMEHSATRSLFLALPYGVRSFLARGLRPLMRRSLQYKRPEIVDADQNTIEQVIRSHGVAELIHGHTHRPGIHHFAMNGREIRRIVLGDWYEDDSVLVCRGDQRHLLRVQDYLNQVT